MPLPLISAVFPTVLSAIFIEADVFRTGWHGDRVCFVPCCNPSNPERALSACFESSFDCDHGEEELVWVILEGYKFRSGMVTECALFHAATPRILSVLFRRALKALSIVTMARKSLFG